MNPWAAAVAAFVMILGAAYLLWMFQRVVTGELSGFLAGLGSHLTDISPIEILTLAPLAALVVAFGLFPGILLDTINGSGRDARSTPRRPGPRSPSTRSSWRSAWASSSRRS